MVTVAPVICIAAYKAANNIRQCFDDNKLTRVKHLLASTLPAAAAGAAAHLLGSSLLGAFGATSLVYIIANQTKDCLLGRGEVRNRRLIILLGSALMATAIGATIHLLGISLLGSFGIASMFYIPFRWTCDNIYLLNLQFKHINRAAQIVDEAKEKSHLDDSLKNEIAQSPFLLLSVLYNMRAQSNWMSIEPQEEKNLQTFFGNIIKSPSTPWDKLRKGDFSGLLSLSQSNKQQDLEGIIKAKAKTYLDIEDLKPLKNWLFNMTLKGRYAN